MDDSSISSTEAAPGLYVHVPFCRSLCPYCDFTIALSDPDQHPAFVAALKREHAGRAPRAGSRTLYLGGGTPTELGLKLLPELLRSLVQPGVAEVTVEANPESASLELLRALVEAGAHRFSVGVQSTDAGVLALLGRGHDARAARMAVESAREAGARSVNVDLMFGLPGQAQHQWRESLEEVLSWGPDHLSCYSLELAAHVPMARRIRAGRLPSPRDQEAESMYLWLIGRAAQAGFEHYEVSNFARPGHRSLHNQSYWARQPVAALGPGSHAFDGRVRSWNIRPHRQYVDRIQKTGEAVAGSEILGDGEASLERLFLGLRTRDGVRVSPEAAGVVDTWAADQPPEFLDRFADRLRLSETGFWYSDRLTLDLAAALEARGVHGWPGQEMTGMEA